MSATEFHRAAELVGAAPDQRSTAAELVGAAPDQRSTAAELVGAAPDQRSTTVQVGSVRTVPNLITAVRTVVAVVVGVAALVTGSVVLLLIAYGCYWIGDILDGWAARRLRQETRIGAVFDIVSDRACTAVLCLTLVTLVPDVAVVAAVFLLSFMVLDTMLSLAFLCWPLLSPNDFHRVDRRVWRLNWSPPAKAANTAGVIATVACGQYALALGLALAVVAVKLWSAAAVVRLLDRRGPA